MVATNNPYELYGSKLEIVDNDLNTIFSYLVNASCVLSSCIDWLLIAMMTKDCRAKIIGKKPYEKPFSLVYNHGFIGAENVVIENDNYLSPIEVLEIMKRG